MPKQRQTQHKAQREEQRAKEMVDLKRDNQKLQRQVARLRKELARHATELPEEVEVAGASPVPVPDTKDACPGCNSPLKRLKLGPSTWEVCSSCKFTRKT